MFSTSRLDSCRGEATVHTFTVRHTVTYTRESRLLAQRVRNLQRPLDSAHYSMFDAAFRSVYHS